MPQTFPVDEETVGRVQMTALQQCLGFVHIGWVAQNEFKFHSSVRSSRLFFLLLAGVDYVLTWPLQITTSRYSTQSPVATVSLPLNPTYGANVSPSRMLW